MPFPISDLIGRFRSKVDPILDQKDVIPQDGTSYTVVLTQKPIVSGSDETYLNQITFTTGLDQFIPLNLTQSAAYAANNNITYTMNYTRGEMKFYQGSGTLIVSTGLVPFAPWSTSNAIVYYKYSTYSDDILSDYLSYAVAAVESSLQLGMYVSGLSTGPAPQVRSQTDIVSEFSTQPYLPQEKLVIADDLEVLQELIVRKALVDVLTKERRIGVGNAIKIVDGDTQIDTSVNQRYLGEFLRDIRDDYEELLKWVMMEMFEGVSLQAMNERANTIFGISKYYQSGGLAVPIIS